MKKKTTEQFIKDVIKVYGNKYDYSLVDYKSTNKINIGIFTPDSTIFPKKLE